MKTVTVNQILDIKGRDIWSVTPGSSVLDTIKLMMLKNVGSALVIKNNKLKGIMTERDYTCKVVLKGRSSIGTPVKSIMTRKLFCVGVDNTINECMALMTEKRIRHLPVFDNAQLVGIISIGDIVKEVISKQQYKIAQLEKYIYG